MESSDIIGHYSPEETAVLRSIHEPTMNVNTNPNKAITILYKVTEIHTRENLNSEEE